MTMCYVVIEIAGAVPNVKKFVQTLMICIKRRKDIYRNKKFVRLSKKKSSVFLGTKVIQ